MADVLTTSMIELATRTREKCIRDGQTVGPIATDGGEVSFEADGKRFVVSAWEPAPGVPPLMNFEWVEANG